MAGRLVHFEIPADGTRRALDFYGSQGNSFSLYQGDESVPSE